MHLMFVISLKIQICQVFSTGNSDPLFLWDVFCLKCLERVIYNDKVFGYINNNLITNFLSNYDMCFHVF